MTQKPWRERIADAEERFHRTNVTFVASDRFAILDPWTCMVAEVAVANGFSYCRLSLDAEIEEIEIRAMRAVRYGDVRAATAALNAIEERTHNLKLEGKL